MTTIAEVAGVDRQLAMRLRKAGVKTTKGFLERAREDDHLRLLSEQTGIDHRTLLDIAASADLMRLEGLGSKYCALLRMAGIDTVDKLSSLSASDVSRAIEDANHRTRLIRRLPSPGDVASWVQQAAGQDGETAAG